MKGFFKIFFASLVSLIVFTLIVFFLIVAWITNLVTSEKVKTEPKSVLVIELSQHYQEQEVKNPLSTISDDPEADRPGLYDVIRLIAKAKTDNDIAGIYLTADANGNSFASSDELRTALTDFKKSKKFIFSYANVMPQRAYAVASIADKVFLNPSGFLEWVGYSATFPFIKGTLDKLDIQMQVFYAGKFKSATEVFRTDKMTPANKLQTTVWLNNLYNNFLLQVSDARKIDTSTLHQLANAGKIQTAKDALDNKLVDALKYDDEVKDEIRSRLDLGKTTQINFISIKKYAKAGNFRRTGTDRIAVIYAEGDIVDGDDSRQGMIASDVYVKLIRKARMDKSIKAIVFRVNSGGGSALASDNIWREIVLAKKEKPVVVSMGDLAASGGYYISCAADSIFAEPTTITGSIGVFSVIPNMQSFFKNKLGVTFDGVKTAPYADAGTLRPFNENEKQMAQHGVDLIYSQFKKRVADGRKTDTAYVDSIAQGRVWTGNDALRIGLVDRIGGLQEAVECAARMAKVTDYRLREFPQVKTFLERLLGSSSSNEMNTSMLEKELGPENVQIYKQVLEIRRLSNGVQARLPFQFIVR
jgi:protease IV